MDSISTGTFFPFSEFFTVFQSANKTGSLGPQFSAGLKEFIIFWKKRRHSTIKIWNAELIVYYKSIRYDIRTYGIYNFKN